MPEIKSYDLIYSIYPDPEKLGCVSKLISPIILTALCRLLSQRVITVQVTATEAEYKIAPEKKLSSFKNPRGIYMVLQTRLKICDIIPTVTETLTVV